MRHCATWNGARTAYHQIRDYARCIGRPWSWRNAAADLGLGKRIVLQAMRYLRDEGEIVRVGEPRHGMYIHVSRHRRANQAQRNRRILAAMKPEVIYTARGLRGLTGLADLATAELDALAEAGKIEKRISSKQQFSWIRRINAKD